MNYEALRIARALTIDEVVSIHYFEYASNYFFEGERHDFWEFVYVDKGEVDVRADELTLRLTKGQIIFHKPNEFHAIAANGVVAPNLVVVSFVCRDEGMRFFEGRVLSVDDEARALLSRIVKEGEAAFSTPLGDPLTPRLERREQAPFGAEQLIAASIEQLLIHFVRRGAQAAQRQTTSIRASSQQAFFEQVQAYLETNVRRRLTLADICRDNLAGRSYLQKIFREKTGGGAMEYFGTLKIETAKRMIREGAHNFTEIAALLGYTSIHYFSRHFKKVSGMTPSEYASSIKALSDKNRAE